MLVADALAELAQVDGEVAHQLVLGVLADRRGDLLARHRGQRLGAPRAVRAQAGLDGPEARHAGRLAQRREPARAEVDRVQRQAEGGAVLEARALEVGRGRRLGRQRGRVRLDRVLGDADVPRAGGDDAAAARISSGSAHSSGADDHDRAARVVQQAGRDAAQHRGGERRAAAAAGHDHARVELVGGLDEGGEERAAASARRAARRRSRRRGPARRPRRPALGGLAPRPRRAPGPSRAPCRSGSASRAAGAASSKLVQAVATTAGPCWSTAPARSIAALAWADPS